MERARRRDVAVIGYSYDRGMSFRTDTLVDLAQISDQLEWTKDDDLQLEALALASQEEFEAVKRLYRAGMLGAFPGVGTGHGDATLF